MPAWVGDHKKWEEAKKQVKRSDYKDENSYWAVVASVYKKIGGSILK